MFTHPHPDKRRKLTRQLIDPEHVVDVTPVITGLHALHIRQRPPQRAYSLRLEDAVADG